MGKEEVKEDLKQEYDFKKRLKALEREWVKCFQEAIKLGFNSEKSAFSIVKIDEDKRIAHIRFTPDIMKMLPDISNHSDITKKKRLLEKTLLKPDAKPVIITSNEIIIRDEAGLSLARDFIDRACSKIKQKLREKIAKEKKIVSETKEKLISDAQEIISKLPKPELMKTFHRPGTYFLKIIFFKNRRRANKKKNKMFPQGFTGWIHLVGSPKYIIQELKCFVDTFPQKK